MHKTIWTRDTAKLVYHLVGGVKNFDFCSLIIRQMIAARDDTRRIHGFPCLVTRVCGNFEIIMSNSREELPKPLKEGIINKMRGQMHSAPNLRGDASNSQILRRLQRKSDCCIDLIDHDTTKYPDLTSELYDIASKYQDIKSEKEFDWDLSE